MQIFLFSLDSDAHHIESTGLLSSGELARAVRYQAEEDRLRFVNGRLWLRAIFAHELACPVDDITVTEVEGEAPRISYKGSDVPFGWSLSRSGSLGAIALSPENNVGIDIETEKEIAERHDIAKTHFSLKEQEFLDETPNHFRNRQFLRLWTAKEALTKAQGMGLSADWTRFTVDPQGPRLIEGEGVFRTELWHLEGLEREPGWLGCVASNGPLKNLRLQDLRA